MKSIIHSQIRVVAPETHQRDCCLHGHTTITEQCVLGVQHCRPTQKQHESKHIWATSKRNGKISPTRTVHCTTGCGSPAAGKLSLTLAYHVGRTPHANKPASTFNTKRDRQSSTYFTNELSKLLDAEAVSHIESLTHSSPDNIHMLSGQLLKVVKRSPHVVRRFISQMAFRNRRFSLYAAAAKRDAWKSTRLGNP